MRRTRELYSVFIFDVYGRRGPLTHDFQNHLAIFRAVPVNLMTIVNDVTSCRHREGSVRELVARWVEHAKKAGHVSSMEGYNAKGFDPQTEATFGFGVFSKSPPDRVFCSSCDWYADASGEGICTQEKSGAWTREWYEWSRKRRRIEKIQIGIMLSVVAIFLVLVGIVSRIHVYWRQILPFLLAPWDALWSFRWEIGFAILLVLLFGIYKRLGELNRRK